MVRVKGAPGCLHASPHADRKMYQDGACRTQYWRVEGCCNVPQGLVFRSNSSIPRSFCAVHPRPRVLRPVLCNSPAQAPSMHSHARVPDAHRPLDLSVGWLSIPCGGPPSALVCIGSPTASIRPGLVSNLFLPGLAAWCIVFPIARPNLTCVFFLSPLGFEPDPCSF